MGIRNKFIFLNKSAWNCSYLSSSLLPCRTCATLISASRNQNKFSGADTAGDKLTRTQPPWRILFFGTDNFSLGTLKVLQQIRTSGETGLVETLEVVTKEKGPVRDFAERNDLVIHSWPIAVNREKFDVGILASFGKLIPKKVIQMFPFGILNVHPSLLPRWRGAAPIPHTILNGDKQTGISIMQLRPAKFDQGPVLLQEKCPIPQHCTSFQLAEMMSVKGGNLLLLVLNDLVSYVEKSVPQDKEGITLAPKLKPSVSCINWRTQSCEQVYQQYRAFHEMLPLRTEWRGLPVKLQNMTPPDPDINALAEVYFGTTDFRPGQPLYSKAHNILYIRCKNGWAGFRKIILKKPMTPKDFDCGYLSKSHNKGMKFTSLENGLFLNSDS